MHDPELERRLARLLASSQAEPDDAPLTRALTALAERDRAAQREPAWFGWLARPAALATACLLLAVSVSASAWMLRDVPVTTGATDTSDLIAGLLGEDGSLGLATSEASGASMVQDSGGVR